MRLIDADRLIEDMGASCLPIMEKNISGITGDESTIMDHINAAPTIDAVPVVRCKDCKWWGLPEGMYATENVKHCEFGRYMVASDGYCVYGEVKSNESE